MKSTKDPEIKLRNGVYYFIGTPVPGGGQVRRSLGAESFGKALQAKKELLLDLRGISAKDAFLTFENVAEVFRKDKARISQSTRNKCNSALNYLLPFFGRRRVATISEEMFNEYVESQRERTPDRKLENDTVHLNMILKRAYEKGVIPRPVSFKNPDPSTTRRRALTEEELRTLRKGADSLLRDYVDIAATMGMRPSEILSLEWKDVDLASGFITILAKKNKNARMRKIMASPDALEVLRRRRDESPGDFVFPGRFKGSTHLKTMDGPFRKVADQAGLDPALVPYNLRHTFCTNAARNIRDGKTQLVHVCRYCDHDIRTFEKYYLHLTAEDTAVIAGLVKVPK
jgi:integrase